MGNKKCLKPPTSIGKLLYNYDLQWGNITVGPWRPNPWGYLAHLPAVHCPSQLLPGHPGTLRFFCCNMASHPPRWCSMHWSIGDRRIFVDRKPSKTHGFSKGFSFAKSTAFRNWALSHRLINQTVVCPDKSYHSWDTAIFLESRHHLRLWTWHYLISNHPSSLIERRKQKHGSPSSGSTSNFSPQKLQQKLETIRCGKPISTICPTMFFSK